jgi:hypothetical protein
VITRDEFNTTASPDTFEVVRGISTGVAEQGVPFEFGLEQNYPNPFNPSTSIKWQVAESRFVTLKVFDLLGREVATLVNEMKQPGRYEVNWNAAGLASGVYTYRLQSGPYNQTRKLLLLR